MILRKFQFYGALLLSLHLLTTATAQNARSYDEDDWIPITPSTPAENTKKAQPRVLNLEAPSQNYFSDSDYLGKRTQPQQYIQQTSFQKGTNNRQAKPQQPYKFEPVLPLQPPQYVQGNHFVQPQVQPHFVQSAQQLPYVQTLQQVQQVPRPVQQQTLNQQVSRPLQQQTLNQQLVAPPENTQNYYDTNANNSFVQSNIGSINQELLGAIHNQNINQVQLTTPTPNTKQEKESVQLLYVPLENLQSNQPVTSPRPPLPKRTEAPRREKQIPHLQNQLHSNIQDDFIRQALAAHKLHQQFQQGQPVVFEATTPTTTTERSKKRKANQPPLAVYMEKEGAADVKDVLQVLKHAKSISVQDSAGPDSPKVFVGPSSINPEGYVKFPLPYLSTVQGNRIERKVEQLPFFVAPLSYKTPEGYSKIPLPSPHVGSVVVSTKEQLHEKHPEFRQPVAAQNQIVPDFDVKQPFVPYRDRPEPNPYLLNQNSPQPIQNPLLSFGSDFLGGFPNSPQGYEVSSSKGFANDDYPDNTRENYDETPSRDFAPDYQLGGRGNSDQYYETTPKYKPTERTNNYQVPDYPSNERDFSNQNSKEVVQDYDIPSLPVESKTTFSPTYQAEQKPNSNQFTSTLEQKSPASVYRLEQEPVAQTTTTTTTEPPRIVSQNEYKLIQNPQSEVKEPQYTFRGNIPRDPLRQSIDQYEIEQINSQFGEDKARTIEPTRSTTPSVISTRRYNDYDVPSTTARSRSRSRHRGRTTTTSTTPNSISEENYTVLEEFAIQPKTSTAKYTTEVETIPAKVYKLESEPAPVYTQNQQPVKGQTLNQELLDQQILHGRVQSRPPVNHQFVYDSVPSRPTADFNQQVAYNNPPSRPTGNFNQQFVASKPTADFNQQSVPLTKTTADEERSVYDVQDPRLTPLVYNRGQEVREQEEQVNPYLPGLINNLQDQAVRPLLTPNLLVPTTEKLTTEAPQVSTEEIRVTSTTTEAPRVETTTQRRSRGRQRAQTSRYSSTSAPRRTASRRRPTYTRPTTERQYTRTTTEAAADYEPTRRVSTNRQRFRTRGRPATERVAQTTENVFKQPPLEGGFQASSGDPQSYMQFDHVVDNQQVITIKPQSNEETPIKEYHQVYSLPPQSPSTERILENFSTTSKPVLDVKITHPVTDRTHDPVIISTPSGDSRFYRVNSNIQSGGVIYNNKQEVTSRAPARSRTRSRTRGRLSSTTPRTTTTRTTTPKPQQEDEEEEGEFYGFIRQPDFQKPAPVIQTTTQQTLPLYSATYQQSPRTLIQFEEERNTDQNQDGQETIASPAPVQFIGQIRPKYTTTETPEYSTEAPKIRTRGRIRIPSRKVTSHPQQSYNEVKSQRLNDQVTRRSNVIQTRSRGKSHYKMPENVTSKKDEHDVEGGNYPAGYLKNKGMTTEKSSSFQITVDPPEDEDDQVPHSSLYRPQIIRNTDTQWVEASILPTQNDLQIEDKQMFVTSSEEQTTLSIGEEQTETEIPTTTEIIETTTPKRKTAARRRGVWKLVKHKPVDGFETAESQNYHSVLNAFEEIEKKFKDEAKTTTTTTRRPTTTTTTESSIFETLYNMLGLASKASQSPQSKTKVTLHKEEITTTTASPTFPEEYTDPTTIQVEQETTIQPQMTTTTTEAAVKNYDVEPLETQDVKTSTSTEVSHETEICFKGRCVKSKDDETRS